MDAVVQQVLETEHGLKLGRRIGTGGFAEVWEARTSQDVPCAVKVSLRPLDGETAQIQKELQTLELLKGLGGHPHVVSLMDVWQIGGYLVTRWELAPDEKARSLEDLLQYYQAEGKRGIPIKELFRYIYDAAQGIDFLNNQGIVHRDIKPGNLLLFWGRVKVGDLGLAKFVGASTASHTGAGTWGYLPPEAYQGRIGPTVDLYSLAATYVRLRTGREPFGTDPVEILDRQRAGQPILDGLRPEEAALVREALSPDPDARPQSGAVAWVRKLYQACFPSHQAGPKPQPKSASPPSEYSADQPAQPGGIPVAEAPQGTYRVPPEFHSPSFSKRIGQEKKSKKVIRMARVGAIGGAINLAIGGAALGAIGGAIEWGIVGAIVGVIYGAIVGAIGGTLVGAIVGVIAGAIDVIRGTKQKQ